MRLSEVHLIPCPKDFNPQQERELAIQEYARALGIPIEALYPAKDVTPNTDDLANE